MPIYTIELDGKTYEIEGTRPPTEADARAAVASFSAPAPAVPTEPSPGVLTSIKDNLLSGAKGALEFVGRPGEFVSGTIAGGLGRGWDALTEGNFADSQIQESMSKVLAERGILKDSPAWRAAAGFGLDVLTDPLNLLGGAGIARSAMLKGLKGAGVAEATAKNALGLGIGEAFQKTVVPAAKAGVYSGASKVPGLSKLMSHADLAQVHAPNLKVTGKELKQGSEAGLRAEYGVAEGIASKFVKEHNLSMDERVLLSTAKALPTSPEAAQVAADPRLAGALADLDGILKKNLAGDVNARLIDPTKELPISAKVRRAIDDLSLDERAQLERAFTPAPGQVAPTGPLSPQTLLSIEALPPSLRKIANSIVRETQRDGSFFADLHTMQLGEDGVLRVSSEIPNYVPQHMPSGVDKMQDLIGVSKGVNPNLKAENARSLTWEEHIRSGGVKDIGELLVNRLKDSARAKTSRELLENYAREFGSTTIKDGYRTLKNSELDRMPETLKATFQNLHLPKAVADDIERVQVRMRDPIALEGLGSRGLKLFKTMATTLRLPAHQATNFLGNIANMYAAGGMRVDEVIRSYANALKTLDAPKLPFGAYLAPVKVGDITYHGQDLIDLAVSKGVVGEMSGFTSEFARHPTLTPTAKLLTGQKFSPLNPDNPVYQGLRDVNQQWIEDPAKLALFHWKLSKGATVEEAAATVRKVLFDYAELTDVEKSIRQIVPFYCVPESAEALTKAGWKHHHELEVGEPVMVFDPQTHEMRWEPLQGVATFPFEGTLRTFERRGGSFAFTDEHRWPVEVIKTRIKGKTYGGERDVLPASALNTSHMIPTTGEFRGKDSSLSPRHAAILGWVVTDGHGRWKGNYWEAVVYQSPNRYLQEIVDLLGTSPRAPHPTTGVVAVPVALADNKAITQHYTNKSDLPALVTQLSREAAEAMWTAMFHAEGHSTPRDGAQSFAQNPGPVLEAFQILSAMTGRCAWMNPRGANVRSSKYLRVKEGMGAQAYTGVVWCPQTPTGTWIMRQGGAVIPTGNTWTRKNVPLQMATLLTNPAKLSNQKRFLDMYRNWAAYDELPDANPDQLPSYVKSQEYIPVPEGLGGRTKDGKPVYTNVRLPMFDLDWLDAEEGPKKAGFSLSPMVRAPLELLLGHKLGSPGQTIDDRVVDASLLGRLTGLGAAPDAQGKLKQSSRMRWAQELFPLPLSSTLRTVDEGDTGAGMPKGWEAFWRASGSSPVAFTDDLAKRGVKETRSKRQKLRKALLNERQLQELFNGEE